MLDHVLYKIGKHCVVSLFIILIRWFSQLWLRQTPNLTHSRYYYLNNVSVPPVMTALTSWKFSFFYIVVISGIGDCRNEYLWFHLWRKFCHHDNSLVSTLNCCIFYHVRTWLQQQQHRAKRMKGIPGYDSTKHKPHLILCWQITVWWKIWHVFALKFCLNMQWFEYID